MANKYEVVDIPKMTNKDLFELEVLKEKRKRTQKEKDRMDYLEFLKTANFFRVRDPRRAVKAYERAIWEKKVGFVDGLIYKVMRMFNK